MSRRKMTRRTFSLHTSSEKKDTSSNQEKISTEAAATEVYADEVGGLSSSKKTKQSVTSSKELLSNTGNDDRTKDDSSADSTTEESNVSRRRLRQKKQMQATPALYETEDITEDVMIVENSGGQESTLVSATSYDKSSMRQDSDDVQVISVSNPSDTAGESTEDPNAEKRCEDGCSKSSSSADKSGETVNRQVSRKSEELLSRQVSSNDGISSPSQASVSLLTDNLDLTKSKVTVDSKSGDKQDKQEKRLSGSKRSRTSSSSSSDSSDSDAESQAKRRRSSGIRIQRGLAARLKRLEEGGSLVSTATNPGSAPEKATSTHSLSLPGTSVSATTYQSTNQDQDSEMEVMEESGAPMNERPLTEYAGETINPNDHEDAAMHVVESDKESIAEVNDDEVNTIEEDEDDAEEEKENVEEKHKEDNEVKQRRKGMRQKQSTRSKKDLEENHRNEENEQEDDTEADFVPPTPPKGAEDTSITKSSTVGTNRLMNRQLSITMEHILTTDSKKRKSKSPPMSRSKKSPKSVIPEASESLLSGSAGKKAMPNTEPKQQTERTERTEIRPSCFAFEPETETEAHVPFIQTVDNDIFTADDEEETMDPTSFHHPHGGNGDAKCVRETVMLSSDEDEPVRRTSRGQRKSRAISDESDEASSQGSDTTGRSLNASSGASGFSIHTEMLSSQHEAHMKADIARIEDEIKKLEQHLAKSKQGMKDKTQSKNRLKSLTRQDSEVNISTAVSDSENDEDELDHELPSLYHTDVESVPDSGSSHGKAAPEESVQNDNIEIGVDIDKEESNMKNVSDENDENDVSDKIVHTETVDGAKEVTCDFNEWVPSPTPPSQMPDLVASTAEVLAASHIHSTPRSEQHSAPPTLKESEIPMRDDEPSERPETEALFSPSQRVKSELHIQGGQYKNKNLNNLSNLRSPLAPLGPSMRNASAKKSATKSVTSSASPRTPSLTVGPSPSTPVLPLSKIKKEKTQSPAPTESDFLELPQRPDWVITTSGITKMKIKTRIEKFVKLIGCKLAGKFSRSTTHVIIAQDDDSDDPLMCQRTLKYFQGVAGGRWILSHLWIVESLCKGQILPTDDYEIHGDVVHGLHQAPRRARLAASPLMQDFEICCYADFRDLKKDDIHDIIEMVGGCIVQHPSMFSFDPAKRPVILVEDDNKKDCATLRKFHNMYEVPVVAKDWLLDSVGCFRLQKISEWAVDLNPSGCS